MNDPFATYDSWLASPYAEEVCGEAEDDWEVYQDTFWSMHKAAFEAEREALHMEGITWKEYSEVVQDEMMSQQDFYEQWMDNQEEVARDRYLESRYPGARI